MGRAKKFKEQRKIEKIEAERKKKERKKIALRFGIFLVIGAIVGTGIFFGTKWIKNKYFSNKQITQASSYKTGDHKYSQAPDMQIDPAKIYLAKFETTEGDFTVELNAKEAPKTVNNFVVLSKDGFYNGLTFHRIISGFMIQGGDPDGSGSGGPGYTIPAEIKLKHTTGAIATARMGDQANPNKDSSGSQFFIDLADQPSLDQGGYTVFGYVKEGMEVVTKLGATEVADNGQGEKSKPVKAPVINKVTIEEK